MNARDLEYLVAVAKLGHFGKAAKHCHVSQPALSIQIKRLEESLGVILLERTPKKISLTPIGEKVVERAQRIINALQDLKEVAKASQEPFAQQLTLGAFHTIAPYLFPQVVPIIKQHYPNTSLYLQEDKSKALLEKLEIGEIDATFIALPLENEKLEVVPLFEDLFYLACLPDSPLAKKKTIKGTVDIEEPILLMMEGHCLGGQAKELMGDLQGHHNLNFCGASLETVRQMVIAGAGVTLIPKSARNANDGLLYIPIEHPYARRTIAIAWRKTSPYQKDFQSFSKLMRENLDVENCKNPYL